LLSEVKKEDKIYSYDFKKEIKEENWLGSKEALVTEKPLSKLLVIMIFLMCVIAIAFVNVTAPKTIDFYISLFTSITFLYFLTKMVFSFFYKPSNNEIPHGEKVSVVIPSYNEKTDAVLKTIECLLNEDYPLHEIIFIDDGSTDPSAYYEVKRLAHELEAGKLQVASTSFQNVNLNYVPIMMPKIITHRFEENKGKRFAQAWGFQRATGDKIMIVDSDGYIYPDAVRELLKPFQDEKVLAVTGHVNVRNLKDNLITRLQDILYQSAFRVGRGSQSVTNSVLVCSGAISMFRKDFILRNLPYFIDQKLFGKPLNIGDDRRLTTLALREGGKVKYQSTARCITDVPTTIKQFFKQQVRWSKSFYLDSLSALTFAWKRPLMLMWLLGEGTIWAIFAVSVLATWFSASVAMLKLIMIYSIGYLCLTALSHDVYYIFRNPLMYLISPFFAFIHMLLIFPIRLYALLTLFNTGWGTR
jgi:hyaluronan synthase